MKYYRRSGGRRRRGWRRHVVPRLSRRLLHLTNNIAVALLIGTRKGGTTALSSLLKLHPSIVMPNCSRVDRAQAGGVCWWDKEVRYYSRAVKKFDACWYRGLYSCPSGANRYVAFDGSPDYFILDAAAVARMSADLGGRARVRLIAMLRNPSDRFYSAYNMGMSEHLQKQMGSNQALAGAADRIDAATYSRFASEIDRLIACAPECPHEPKVVRMFFHYGLYAQHLQTYIDAFGREALLIESSEDFYSEAWPTVRRVLEFARLPITPSFKRLVRQKSRRSSSAELNRGSLWASKGATYSGKLQPTERRKLSTFYAPHNKQLYTLLGRDFGWEEVELDEEPSRGGRTLEDAGLDDDEDEEEETIAELHRRLRMRPEL